MSPTEPQGLRQRYPLQKAKIIKKSIGHLIGLGVIAVVSSIILAFISPLILILLLFGLIAISALIVYYNILYFNKYRYNLTQDGLQIGKGVIQSWQITVPPHKVQDVYLDQDVLDRLLGLYDLHLSTATGASEREAHIDGLSSDDAKKLRTELMSWISKDQADEGKDDILLGITPSTAGLIELAGGRMLSVFFILIWLAGTFGFLASIIILPIIAILSYLDYRAMKFTITEQGFQSHIGYFIPRESMLLFRNIQDVEERLSFTDRIFGTSTLIVKTMTASSTSNANIKYVSRETAEKAKKLILERCEQAANQPKRTSGTTASSSDSPDGARAIVQKPATKMESQIKPYPNHFMKSALYNNAYAIGFAVAVSALMLILTFSGIPWYISSSIMFLILVVVGFVLVSSFVSAIILNISYTYEISTNAVRITTDFISKSERQILFRKIQDIEESQSFAHYLAKLSTLIVETGSKELIQTKNKQTISSQSVASERIPALDANDSKKLKLLLARQLGVDLKGIGENPLRHMIPLSGRKPMKKSAGFAFSILLGVGLISILSLFLPIGFGVVLMLLVLSALAVGLRYLYELYYLQRYFYDLNDDVLVIRKGVFGFRELTIPFSKIHSIYIDQDLFDKLFGLYDVYVSTVTARSITDAHIDGLKSEHAEAVANIIAKRVSEKL